jgi:hypothetical protein
MGTGATRCSTSPRWSARTATEAVGHSSVGPPERPTCLGWGRHGAAAGRARQGRWVAPALTEQRCPARPIGGEVRSLDGSSPARSTPRRFSCGRYHACPAVLLTPVGILWIGVVMRGVSSSRVSACLRGVFRNTGLHSRGRGDVVARPASCRAVQRVSRHRGRAERRVAPGGPPSCSACCATPPRTPRAVRRPVLASPLFCAPCCATPARTRGRPVAAARLGGPARNGSAWRNLCPSA